MNVGSTKNFYAVLAGLAFGLNWIWEMIQMFAFEIKLDDSRAVILLFCTLASVVDAAVTVAIYSGLKSLMKPERAKFYLSSVFLGAWCAVFFEWFARLFNLWAYNGKMIVIPLLETGLLPFLQLTLLVPLAIWLTGKIRKN